MKRNKEEVSKNVQIEKKTNEGIVWRILEIDEGGRQQAQTHTPTRRHADIVP